MEAGSWIRRMFEEGVVLKQQYGEEKVFDLSLGNPIMEPPAEFSEELKRLVEKPIPRDAQVHGKCRLRGYKGGSG